MSTSRRRWAASLGRIGGLFDHAAAPYVLALVLWGLGTVALVGIRATQQIHFDSAEAFAWGRQWLWGHGKHPPVSGWIAGAWFQVFPAADWAVYALARICVIVALLGVYALAARSLTRRGALLTLLATSLWAYAHLRAFKYNPDLVLLALTPWLLLAYLRFADRPTAWRGALLGAVAAAAMLTKYWAAMPLLAFVAAAALDKRRARIIISRGTLAGLIVFLVLLVPHGLWLVQSDFAPMAYADIWRRFSRADVLRAALVYLGHHAAHAAVPVAMLILLCLGARRRGPLPADARPVFVVLAALVVVPPASAILGNVLLRTDLGLSLYVIIPVAAILALHPMVVRRQAMAIAAILAISVHVALALGGIVYGAAAFAQDPGHQRHRPFAEAADAVAEVWRRETGRPVPIVVSSYDLSAHAAFHLPEHPRMLGEADFRMAPWLDRAALEREGFVTMCFPLAFGCDPIVFRLTEGRPIRELQVRRQRFGISGPPMTVRFVIVPPGR